MLGFDFGIVGADSGRGRNVMMGAHLCADVIPDWDRTECIQKRLRTYNKWQKVRSERGL